MNKISGKTLKMNTESLRYMVASERRKHHPKVPSGISKHFEIDDFFRNGYHSYRFVPKSNFQGTYIVYLYGGGMSSNISGEQWEFISKIARKTNCGLFVPIYPLAPESSCADTFNMLCTAYSNFAKGVDVKKIILLGDSSGAGLALSICMLAWQEGLRKPDKLVMLSPCLDTEFFDKDLERIIENTVDKSQRVFFNGAAKDFINKYWVKDYAVKTEYTSPFYGDYTDICDDIVLFSSVDDIFNCYSRAFYNKAKAQGINVRFFEFDEGYHDFMIYEKHAKQKKAVGYLIDVINDKFNHSLSAIYPLKLMSDWSKRYPEIIKDEWAYKFIYDNKFDFSTLKTNISEYRNVMMAKTYAACDEKVAEYIRKFPNCTVVNVGCGLDNMFERLDNGRILWYSVDTHNTMSVRRSMYGKRKREKTIGRSLLDYSWIEDINCKRNQGVIFIFNYTLTYMRIGQVKNLIEKIYNKFPGAEVVMSVSTVGATLLTNLFYGKKAILPHKKKMWINDAQKVINGWRTDYMIMSEEPVLKDLPKDFKLKPFTKISVAYNKISYNHKIIHIKLGSEAYELNYN